MPDTPLKQLSAHGQSVWIDFLSRTVRRRTATSRRSSRDGVARRDVEPDDLPGRDRRRRRLRRAAARGAQDRDRAQGGLPRARRRGHPRRLRRPAPDLGRGRRERPRRLGLARGRPATSRTTRRARSTRPSACTRSSTGPNLFVKIPATQGGPARDRGVDRRGHPDQRHADLLARAPPRGRRGVRARRAAARRRRRRPRPRWRPSPRSSSRASTPRPTSASTRSAATTSSRASSRSPTPSSPTRPTRRSSPATQWEALRAKGASAQRCLWASTSTKNPDYRDVIYVEELIGPRHRQHDAARDASRRSRTTARSRDSLEEDVDGARRTLEAFAAAGIDYDDVVETLEREGVEKFAKSFQQLFADVEAKRDAMVRGMSTPSAGASWASSCAWTPSAPARRPAPAIRPPRCRPPT